MYLCEFVQKLFMMQAKQKNNNCNDRKNKGKH